MEYLQQKQALLESILENTQAQTKAVEDDDMALLEELINKRQETINQVNQLDKASGFKQSEAIKALLSQIITIDNTNQSLMNKELANVKADLLKIRTGRKQGQHYGDEYGLYKEEGVFFDTKE